MPTLMLTRVETSLIGLLLLVLMFGMGATLTPKHFREVAQQPRAFLIGIASQFGFMPLLAFALARAFELPQAAAIGLVVMGTCPGGATSNLFAHLARADVALSISMTAASKLLGVILMPACLYLYARPFTNAELPIPYGEIVKTLTVLLLPVALAMILRARFGERFGQRAERIGGLCGLVMLVALVGISVVRNAASFKQVQPNMYAAAILLGSAGMLFGQLVSRVFGLAAAQRRTVSFETGIQNSPLCFALLVTAFPRMSQLELLELPLLYALFVLIEASVLTVFYRAGDARKSTTTQPELISQP